MARFDTDPNRDTTHWQKMLTSDTSRRDDATRSFSPSLEVQSCDRGARDCTGTVLDVEGTTADTDHAGNSGLILRRWLWNSLVSSFAQHPWQSSFLQLSNLGRSEDSRILIVESVSITKALKLFRNDASKRSSNKTSGSWLLQKSSDVEVNVIWGTVELSHSLTHILIRDFWPLK